jgi:ABC-type polysaccharide/polyol phosphate export permease
MISAPPSDPQPLAFAILMSTLAPSKTAARAPQTVWIGPGPRTRREWLWDQWAHRDVLLMLAQKQFHVRYKRASFGLLWAIAVPAIQAVTLAVVFSHFVHTNHGYSYPAYVVSAVLGWGYFSQTLATGSVAIVDGSTLADKLWFTRAILVISECLANVPGLVVSYVLFLILLPVFGVAFAPHTLLLIPAIVLMVAFASALCLVLSALHVYFRDVRYLVQAALLVLFYLTPVAYPQRKVGALGPWMDFNPLTGLVNLFHLAAVGHPELWTSNVTRSIAITVVTTLALAVVALEVHRRHDRLFVDLL